MASESIDDDFLEGSLWVVVERSKPSFAIASYFPSDLRGQRVPTAGSRFEKGQDLCNIWPSGQVPVPTPFRKHPDIVREINNLPD